MTEVKRKTGFALGTAKAAGRKGGMKSKGRTLSEEHKRKISEAHRRRNELVQKALRNEHN